MDRIMKSMMVSVSLLSLVAYNTYAGGDQKTAENKNLVSNGSFETWDTPKKKKTKRTPELSDGLPVKWNAGKSAYEWNKGRSDFKVEGAVSKDEKIKHDGAASLKITNKLTTDITAAYQLFPAAPNTKYIVRVWIKAQDVVLNTKDGNGVMLWVSFGPKKGFWGHQTHFNKKPKPFKGSFDWQLLELAVDSPKGTGLMKVGLQLRRASGTVWFDSVEVVQQGKVTPVQSF